MAANYSPIVAFGTSPPAIRMSSEFSYPTYQDNARQTFPSSSLSTTGTIDVRKESLVYTSSGSYPSKEIPSETIITTNHYGIKVTRAPSTSARTISTVGETDALPAATSDPLGSTDVTKPTTRTLSTSEGVVTPPTSEDPSGSSGITKPATRTLSTSEGAVTQSITKDPSGSTGIAEPTTRTLSTSEEAVTQSVRKDPSRYTGTAKPVIRTLSTSEEAVTQYITKDPSGSTDTAKPATLSSLGTKLTNSSTSDPQGSHSSTVLHNDSFTTLSSLISESTSAPDDGSLVTTSQPDTTLVTTSQPDTTLVTTSQPDTTLVTTSQPDTTLVTTSQQIPHWLRHHNQIPHWLRRHNQIPHWLRHHNQIPHWLRHHNQLPHWLRHHNQLPHWSQIPSLSHHIVQPLASEGTDIERQHRADKDNIDSLSSYLSDQN
ncbi:hypothetical protein BSL78_19218 [Apostichopus japonicus]|uniref:Uncharacterized protein n=1 Tax=Stichopus japonicus TaxID=307972 RepID=A0A2G8K7K8_STIJA|nr:hypothetical protein BSL78_19218 [Apostichopus japonicus]